ncbi:antA/AntB antirepressor family protein [Glaesserella parasuis]|uniref:antA/AntB antirepressor family protein n=1 Tax=Glaesserella parasuis TaxID=738 RepID=UPI0024370931|nr:antA/AntB antirepressor family protein [Glaesserella parasuis]MDG6331189.1 antA/AntB antirepressor family protein [Glaesserella parasuis]
MPITTFQGVIANQPSILVNARELHTRLQIGKDFSTWIKDRITNYGFQEGLDFSPILGKSKGLFGRPAVEYHITLDMAKELCMLERSELGQKARRYFIQMEKKALQAHQTALPAPTAQSDYIQISKDKYIALLERLVGDIETAPPVRYGRKLNAKEKQHILELHAQGYLVPDIMKQTGRSESAVRTTIIKQRALKGE